ncbi:MAG: prolyl oligopeptidase family serine peptidase [Limisphaerales bacterium]
MKIRSFIFVALGILFLNNVSIAQEKPQDKMQKPQNLKRKITKTIESKYLIFPPKNYSATGKEKFPLILFLHGAGERGTDVWKATTHGPSLYIKDHPDFPFILVTPLCPADEVWSDEVLLTLLDEVIKKNNVDASRIYLTGLSMGGYGAWSLGLKYPEKFAALAPICGGSDIGAIILASHGYATPEKTLALKTLAVWAFHGAKDPVVPLQESEHIVNALKSFGINEIKFTVYPEAQHNSWTETYNNPELYEWFLKHHRKILTQSRKAAKN